MNREINAFIDKYVREIENNNAAFFAGAGFSKEAGYVEWKKLLKGLADELELDVDKENDLVSLAQYYCNKNNNRSGINDLIAEEFMRERSYTENHKILARLPIFTYWTTNYDSLIEDALKDAKRIVDVKSCNSHLSRTIPNRDAVVYKMHGDKNTPNDAILIKDDYEKYYRRYAQFITALSGDLITKTFLFVGFSFEDPNIDYVLSRIQVEYGSQNERQHYAIMRKIKESSFSETAEYEYEKRKQDYFVADLKRYKIAVLLVDEFSEITEILKEIEKRLNRKTIFISGSAKEYGNFDEKEAEEFIFELSKRLVNEGYKIVSGFGLGIGSSVIAGALEEIYVNEHTINHNKLLLRPFPQGNEYKKMWRKYREDMISRAGISLFLFGNKQEDGNIVLANGVREEYEISLNQGKTIVPVGCTGYMAKQLWDEIESDFEKYYPNADVMLKELYYKLDSTTESRELIDSIMSFIALAIQ